MNRNRLIRLAGVLLLLGSVLLALGIAASFYTRQQGGTAAAPEPLAASTDAATGLEWTNPESKITVTIPAGWVPQPKLDGVDVLDFFQNGDVTATYGCDATMDYSLAGYVDAIKSSIGPFQFHATARLDDSRVFKLSGKYVKSGIPATVYIKAVDGVFCHALYRDMGKTLANLDESAITAALFASGRTPVLPPDADIALSSSLLKRFSVRWTNPQTGTLAVLPPGWVPAENYLGVDFINYTEGYTGLYFCYQTPATATFTDYESYLTHPGGLRSTPIRPTGNTEVYRLDKGSAANGNALIYYVGRAPTGFCSVLYQNWLDIRAELLVSAELTKAIFKTLGADYQPEQQVAETWINPDTGISITIPTGWVLSRNFEQPVFFNREYDAVLVCEPQTIRYTDLEDYARVVRHMLGQNYELAEFIPGSDRDTLVSHGGRKGGKHISTVLTAAGSRFCRIDYFADEAGQTAEFTNPSLDRALFASVGDIGLPKPAPASAWTHPETGITVTIPAGWIYQGGGETMVFRNGAFIAGATCNRSVPEGINTLGDYAMAFSESMATNFDISPFQPATTDEILISNGIDRNANAPVTLVVGKAGALYCNIIYGRYGSTEVESLDDPSLSAALFESMKQ